MVVIVFQPLDHKFNTWLIRSDINRCFIHNLLNWWFCRSRFGFKYNDFVINIMETCRICLDASELSDLIFPCYCKGSAKYVHAICLKKWLGINKKPGQSCEICGFNYRTKRTFGGIISIFKNLFWSNETWQLLGGSWFATFFCFVSRDWIKSIIHAEKEMIKSPNFSSVVNLNFRFTGAFVIIPTCFIGFYFIADFLVYGPIRGIYRKSFPHAIVSIEP